MWYALGIIATLIWLSLPAAFAAGLLWLLWGLRIAPRGWAAAPAVILAMGFLSGALMVFTALDDLVWRPANLQREYLAREYGHPTQLIRYEQQLMIPLPDSDFKWRYEIEPQDAAVLRGRCLDKTWPGMEGACILYEYSDIDRVVLITLRNNELLLWDSYM